MGKMINFSSIGFGIALGVLMFFFISGFYVPKSVVLNSGGDVERFQSANPQWLLVSRNDGNVRLSTADEIGAASTSVTQQFHSPESSPWRVTHLSTSERRLQRVGDFVFRSTRVNRVQTELQPALSAIGTPAAIPFSKYSASRNIKKVNE